MIGVEVIWKDLMSSEEGTLTYGSQLIKHNQVIRDLRQKMSDGVRMVSIALLLANRAKSLVEMLCTTPPKIQCQQQFVSACP